MRLKAAALNVVLALGAGAAGFWLGRLLAGPAPAPAAQRVLHEHTGPSLERVRELSSLVTTRLDVADVQETKISGYTGAVRAVLLVKGDVLLSVDLTKAKLE